MRKKHENAQITINLTCNVSESYKFKLWLIEKAAIFCCFDWLSINIKNFRIVWQSNKKV